ASRRPDRKKPAPESGEWGLSPARAPASRAEPPRSGRDIGVRRGPPAVSATGSPVWRPGSDRRDRACTALANGVRGILARSTEERYGHAANALATDVRPLLAA